MSKRGSKLILIDTSIWIESLRPSGSAKAGEALRYAMLARTAVTAEPIIMEVLRGAKTERECDALDDELRALPTLPITRRTWSSAGWLGVFVGRKGKTPPSMDLLIATLAIENDCLLLHADRHFDEIAKITKLRAGRPE